MCNFHKMTNRRNIFQFQANSNNRRGVRRRRRTDSFGDQQARRDRIERAIVRRNEEDRAAGVLGRWWRNINTRDRRRFQRLRRFRTQRFAGGQWSRARRLPVTGHQAGAYARMGGTRLTEGGDDQLWNQEHGDIDVFELNDNANPPPEYHGDIEGLPSYAESQRDTGELPPRYDHSLRLYGGMNNVLRRQLRQFLEPEDQAELDIIHDDVQDRRIAERANWADRLDRNRFRPDRPRDRNRNRPENIEERNIRQRDLQRRQRINELIENNQARRIQAAWRNQRDARRRRIGIANFRDNFNAGVIQNAWRNYMNRRIENALNGRENYNNEENPDNADELEAIRNGELPVDEDGYVHFGENGNEYPEEGPINLNPDRNIGQREIEPDMYVGGGRVEMPVNRAGGGGNDSDVEDGDAPPEGDVEERFIVGNHRVWRPGALAERQREADVIEYNRRHGGLTNIRITDIHGAVNVPFDPYRFKGENYKARNKYVLYWDKTKDVIGIKFVPYDPEEAPNHRPPFNPDFNKRKIYYLHIFDRFDDIGWEGWNVNVFDFANVQVGDFRYTVNDYNNQNDKYINVNIGHVNYRNLDPDVLHF